MSLDGVKLHIYTISVSIHPRIGVRIQGLSSLSQNLRLPFTVSFGKLAELGPAIGVALKLGFTADCSLNTLLNIIKPVQTLLAPFRIEGELFLGVCSKRSSMRGV